MLLSLPDSSDFKAILIPFFVRNDSYVDKLAPECSSAPRLGQLHRMDSQHHIFGTLLEMVNEV